MSKQLAPITALTKDIASQSKQLQTMLPKGMDVNRFMRTTVNAISTHAQADALMKADRKSLFSACQKAAGDGLLIDGKEATLVTFKNQVTYMPMVQGLVKLARNSGEIANIVAEVVYKEDDFSYRPGIDEQPVHSPDWFADDRGKPVGAYAVVILTSGEKICTVMKESRIMAIANGGRNAHQYTPGKGAHFEEWWKKTVIKNVLKYAPKSTYLEQALDNDNGNFDPDAMEPDYTPPAQKQASNLNESLNSQPATEPQQAPQSEPDYSDIPEAEYEEVPADEDII